MQRRAQPVAPASRPAAVPSLERSCACCTRCRWLLLLLLGLPVLALGILLDLVVISANSLLVPASSCCAKSYAACRSAAVRSAVPPAAAPPGPASSGHLPSSVAPPSRPCFFLRLLGALPPVRTVLRRLGRSLLSFLASSSATFARPSCILARAWHSSASLRAAVISSRSRCRANQHRYS